MARKGHGWTIKGYRTPRGEAVVRTYIDGLQDEARKSVYSYLTYCRKHGPWWNPEKIKKLSGEIYELRPTSQVRLFGFFHPSEDKTFVITHGFTKKTSRVPRREFNKAEERRKILVERSER
jgi:phage-related protein